MRKWLSYTLMVFILTAAFTLVTTAIWWAAQYGYWWGLLGSAVMIGILGGTILAISDPAKVEDK